VASAEAVAATGVAPAPAVVVVLAGLQAAATAALQHVLRSAPMQGLLHLLQVSCALVVCRPDKAVLQASACAG
jgi:hypothetical protein